MAERGTKKGTSKSRKAWLGKRFKKEEKERIEKSGIEHVVANRGTTVIPVTDVTSVKDREIIEPTTIVTKRGTGSARWGKKTGSKKGKPIRRD